MNLRTTPCAFLAALLVAAPLLARAEPAGLPAEWTLQGQASVCAGPPRARRFELRAEEKTLPVGMGLTAQVMTFGGRLAPVLEVCQGDTVTFHVTNAGQMAHGLDAHALRMNNEAMGPVDAGGTLTVSGQAKTPGAFVFHCASGPVTDVHIKAGMWGALIVYPRAPLPPAREVAILHGALFGAPDARRLIHSEPGRMLRNDPYTLTFNGRLEHAQVRVRTGERVRVWFVNAGPGTAAVHVMGTLFDRVAASGNPANTLVGVQTAAVPAGDGAMLELTLERPGMYMLVDHDNLRFIPYGLAIPFMAE